MDTFLNFIRYYVPLSEPAEMALREVAKTELIKKGARVLDKGAICKRQNFVISGTLRTYFYQKDKDITYWIYPENGIFTVWHSYWHQKPSAEFAEATEDCELISIHYDQWQKLFDQFPELERFGRLYAQEQLALVDEYYRGYYFLTAQEKYDLLLSFFPSVVNRANLGHIASMLGISQETLSRIRAKGGK